MDSHTLSVMDQHHNSNHHGENQPLQIGLVRKSPRKNATAQLRRCKPPTAAWRRAGNRPTTGGNAGRRAGNRPAALAGRRTGNRPTRAGRATVRLLRRRKG